MSPVKNVTMVQTFEVISDKLNIQPIHKFFPRRNYYYNNNNNSVNSFITLHSSPNIIRGI
jgi:hypothetical protein